MRSLEELAELYGTDKAAHGYCELYERHLDTLPYVDITLLEVGVARGASLRMWRDYFPLARLIGLDKNPAAGEMVRDDPSIELRFDDAAIPRPWRPLEDESIDVLIDDGGHQAEEVYACWLYGWPKVKEGGWYVVEDLAAQWCRGFGGDPVNGSVATTMLGTILEDAVRGRHVSEAHLYREIAFIRKAARPSPPPA